jgi:hypothetical protein
MLGRAIGMHWQALVRDVLALGYRKDDMFTKLSVADMVAIVIGAPPDSSIRFFMDGGWTRTDHILANMQEGQQGLAEMKKPYPRPGLEQRPGGAQVGDSSMFGGKAEEMTWDEAVERDKKRHAAGVEAQKRGIKPTNTRVRTI